MKSTKLLSLVMMVLFCAASYTAGAQTIASGGKLGIQPGTIMTTQSNVTVSSGGTLNNQGTLILKKNLINENAAPTSLGSGTLEMSGTTAQSISGQNIIQNFVVNNPTGVSLAGNTQVNGTMTLTNGIVSLGSNNLTLGPAATVSGTPSSAKMVAADGTGQMRKEFSGPGSFTFPVGDQTVSADYSPVTLNFTSGTFGAGNYAAVNLTDDKYPSAEIVTNYLTRYWNVTQNNITNFSCNPTFKYTAGDIVGTESDLYCVKVNPTPWVGYNLANTGTDELSATGLTSFSTFTGVGVHKTNLTVLLEGLYASGGIMNQAYDEYGPHFPGTTADQITVELHDAGNYSNLIYSSGLIDVSTTGQAYLTAVPPLYSGSYYMTIKHRNSIETTTASPVPFSGSLITYNFTDAANRAFGDNMKDLGDGYFALYTGDVNQDAIVDGGDMNPVDNDATYTIFVGYSPTDINGDGLVDATDINYVDNNSTSIVMAYLP